VHLNFFPVCKETPASHFARLHCDLITPPVSSNFGFSSLFEVGPDTALKGRNFQRNLIMANPWAFKKL
jgi:hypothetical protein